MSSEKFLGNTMTREYTKNSSKATLSISANTFIL